MSEGISGLGVKNDLKIHKSGIHSCVCHFLFVSLRPKTKNNSLL